MADQDTTDYYALCANDQDELKGLNERLMESSISQSLCDLNSSNNSITVENATSVSPLLSHYKYHCFSHHDSPVNFSSLPTYLPPIGVFWDIENCHVSIKLYNYYIIEIHYIIVLIIIFFIIILGTKGKVRHGCNTSN